MSEITVLKTHITNYAKTRDTYVAYRKAGYSNKFLGEHEEKILLHKAAKAAFDELGMEKLPTMERLKEDMLAWSKAFIRTHSHRMKFYVQGGLGDIHNKQRKEKRAESRLADGVPLKIQARDFCALK